MNIGYETKQYARAQGMVQDVKSGEIIYTSPWTKNLILNNGLNFCIDNTYPNLQQQQLMFGGFPTGRLGSDAETYFAYGSGTSPNSYASTICATPVSASQTANIVTLTNTFDDLKQYDVLKYNDGTSTFITSAHPSGLVYVSNKSLEKTNQHFAAWNTSRHTLQAHLATSNTKWQNKDTTISVNSYAGIISGVCYRQFPEVGTFSPSGPHYITEVGACTGEANTTAMATRLTFDAPITVNNGQRFILTYQFFAEIPLLSASFVGYTATSGVNANITNWPTASGQLAFAFINPDRTGLYANYAMFNNLAYYPYSNGRSIALFTDGRPFACAASTTTAPTGFIANSLRTIGFVPYTTNSFEKTYTIVYDPTASNDFSSSNIRCIIWASSWGANGSYYDNWLRFNFETPQTKTALQRLTISLTTKVSRDL